MSPLQARQSSAHARFVLSALLLLEALALDLAFLGRLLLLWGGVMTGRLLADGFEDWDVEVWSRGR